MIWVVGVITIGSVVYSASHGDHSEYSESRSRYSEYSDAARRIEAQKKLKQLEVEKKELYKTAKADLKRFQTQHELPALAVDLVEDLGGDSFERHFDLIKGQLDVHLSEKMEADLAKAIAYDEEVIKNLDIAIASINRIQLTRKRDKQ